MIYAKILVSTTVFNIDNNKKCFWSSKLDDFWRIMEQWCWKFSFAITGINYILKYIQIENSYFEL